MTLEHLYREIAPDGLSWIHHYILWPDEDSPTDDSTSDQGDGR